MSPSVRRRILSVLMLSVQEERLYVSEGVPFDKIPFLDNQPVIELLFLKPYSSQV